MDQDLRRVIQQALENARTAGRDHLSQTELAVRAVLQVRLDMTARPALTAVGLVRRSGGTGRRRPGVSLNNLLALRRDGQHGAPR
jgi:hypothetical protein